MASGQILKLTGSAVLALAVTFVINPTFGQNLAIAALKKDGSLDTNFSGDGKKVAAAPPAIALANDAALRTVVLCPGQLMRFTQDGLLDTSFADHGIQVLPPGTFNGIALDKQGRILVAGQVNSHFAVARYLSNGGLDTTFANGIATVFASGESAANVVTVDSNGHVVAAGYTYLDAHDEAFVLARFNSSSGSLDTSFGTNGVVKTNMASVEDPDYANPERPNAIAIDSNGRIVVAGALGYLTYGTFIVLRYSGNGQLDSSFNGINCGPGCAIPTFFGAYHESASGVAIDSTGKIVVAGSAWTGSEDPDKNHFMAVARLNVNGSLDTTFNSTGKKTVAFRWCYTDANAMALDGNDILLAGRLNYPCTSVFALARIKSDGTLDSSLSAGSQTGEVTVDFQCPGTPSASFPSAIGLEVIKPGSLTGYLRTVLAGYTGGGNCT